MLLTGGLEVGSLFGIPTPEISDDCLRFDPGTGGFLPTASFSGRRSRRRRCSGWSARAARAGGADGVLILLSFFPLASTRVYDHVADAWTNTADLAVPRGFLNLLNTGGSVVAIGGVSAVDLAGLTGTPTTAIEQSSQALLSWSSPGSMLLPRELGISTLIDGGQRVLTTGRGDNGSGGAVPELTAELFVP